MWGAVSPAEIKRELDSLPGLREMNNVSMPLPRRKTQVNYSHVLSRSLLSTNRPQVDRHAIALSGVSSPVPRMQNAIRGAPWK